MKKRNKEIKAAIQSSCEATEKPKNELSSLKKEMGFPTAQNPTIADYQKRSQRRKWTLVAVSSFAVVAAVGGGLAGYYLSSRGIGSLPTDTVIAAKLASKAVTYNAYDKSAIQKSSLSFSANKIQSSKQNTLTSPIGFSLAMAGYAQASDNTDALIQALGFNDIDFSKELKELMAALNWDEEPRETGMPCTRIATLILDQIVDDSQTLSFNKEYRDQLTDSYVSTQKSSSASFLKDAQDVFEKALGVNVSMPPVNTDIPGAITYSGLYLKDSTIFADNLTFPFQSSTGSKSVKGLELKDIYDYYEGTTYQALTVPIHRTALTFILPKEGYSLADVDFLSAYQETTQKEAGYHIKGEVPYFSLEATTDYSTECSTLTQGTSGFSKLVTPTTGYPANSSFQQTRFSFSERGVEGISITETSTAISAITSDKYATFICDRPFYAVSSYDGLPLFGMAIDEIS
jgi:hypothetical protein